MNSFVELDGNLRRHASRPGFLATPLLCRRHHSGRLRVHRRLWPRRTRPLAREDRHAIQRHSATATRSRWAAFSERLDAIVALWGMRHTSALPAQGRVARKLAKRAERLASSGAVRGSPGAFKNRQSGSDGSDSRSDSSSSDPTSAHCPEFGCFFGLGFDLRHCVDLRTERALQTVEPCGRASLKRVELGQNRLCDPADSVRRYELPLRLNHLKTRAAPRC